MKTAPKTSDVERRANRYYVQTGPADLVRAATSDEFAAALARMKRNQHVNRLVVAQELARSLDPETDFVLTAIELDYLEHAAMGVSLDSYATDRGVRRVYTYESGLIRHTDPVLAT